MTSEPAAKPVAAPLFALTEEMVPGLLQATPVVKARVVPSEYTPLALNVCCPPTTTVTVAGVRTTLCNTTGTGVGVGVGVGTGVTLELLPLSTPPPHATKAAQPTDQIKCERKRLMIFARRKSNRR